MLTQTAVIVVSSIDEWIFLSNDPIVFNNMAE